MAAGVIAVATLTFSQSAVAATAPVGLGTAGSYAVLAGSTVTNTGPSVISGNLGVSPGTAVTGFPPGIVNNGTIHTAAAAAGAQAALGTAYTDAASRAKTASITAPLSAGQVLTPGVYNATSSLDVNGQLILNGQGDPSAVFIFQAGSTLTTETGTTISFIGSAQACNVFWQVGSSATLNTGTTFQGTILAQQSISVSSNVTIFGRALASVAAVTLINDTITRPTCSGGSGGSGGSGTGTGGGSGTGAGGSGGGSGTGTSPSSSSTHPAPSPTGSTSTGQQAEAEAEADSEAEASACP